MCKLMIIVEGAAVERGTRVLVRDAAVQVEEEDDNQSINTIISNATTSNLMTHNSTRHDNNSSSMTNIPILKVNSTGTNSNGTSDGCNINLLNGSKYRSTESINVENYNNTNHQHYHHLQQHNMYSSNLNSNSNKKRRVVLTKNVGGGSLSNLNSSPFNAFSNEHNLRRKNDLLQSYLDINDYTSTPYYQYQRKSFRKNDVSSDTRDYFFNSSSQSYKKTTSSTSNKLHDDSHSNTSKIYDDDDDSEMIELEIPIRLVPTVEQLPLHRNERYIVVNKESERDFDQHYSRFKTYTNNMRRYLDDRLNRFEAEITLYNINDPIPHIYKTPRLIHRFRSQQPPVHYYHHHYPHHNYHNRHQHHHHQQHQDNQNSPITYSYHCRKNVNDINSNFSSTMSSSSSSGHNHCSEASVTNLMLMQIIDGKLIE